MTTTAAHAKGLAGYRQRLAEEKKVRMAALAVLREQATTAERDGRTFVVLRIPDKYEFRTLKRKVAA